MTSSPCGAPAPHQAHASTLRVARSAPGASLSARLQTSCEHTLRRAGASSGSRELVACSALSFRCRSRCGPANLIRAHPKRCRATPGMRLEARASDIWGAWDERVSCSTRVRLLGGPVRCRLRDEDKRTGSPAREPAAARCRARAPAGRAWPMSRVAIICRPPPRSQWCRRTLARPVTWFRTSQKGTIACRGMHVMHPGVVG